MSVTRADEPKVYSILISGELGSGKTTLQRLLEGELRRLLSPAILIVAVNFADELKRECAERAGVPASTFYTEEGKARYFPPLGMTGRQLLQTVGEEARQKDPEHWVKRAKQTINKLIEGSGARQVVAIIGDCRHPNEVDAMRPGLAVRLTGDPGGARARSSADLTHISERGMDDFERFDMHINSDKTTPEMEVLAVFERLTQAKLDLFGELIVTPPAKR